MSYICPRCGQEFLIAGERQSLYVTPQPRYCVPCFEVEGIILARRAVKHFFMVAPSFRARWRLLAALTKEWWRSWRSR